MINDFQNAQKNLYKYVNSNGENLYIMTILLREMGIQKKLQSHIMYEWLQNGWKIDKKVHKQVSSIITNILKHNVNKI